MASVATYLFLLILSELWMLQSFVFVCGDTDLIQRTCRNTNNYKLCVSYLQSDPQSFQANASGLAFIILNKAEQNVNNSCYYISKLLRKRSLGSEMKKMMMKCAARYNEAKDALRESVEALSSELYDYANLHVTAAAEYSNFCHGLFKLNPRVVYPLELSRREKGLEHLCDIASTIITLLV